MIFIYIYVHVYMHIYVCVYVYVCMYVHIYLYMFYMYVSLSVFRDIPKACIAFCHIVVYYKCCTVTLFFAPYFDNLILTMTLTMTMKIILLPCNTCGVHSDNMTLTSYIQQSVI